jgi:ureidoacrylate peracid hydrolase
MHEIRWPATPADRAAALNIFDAIEPSRTALVVVDLQVGTLVPGYPAYCANAIDTVPKVNRLASGLRAAGGVVAFTRHTHFPDDPLRGPPRWWLELPWLNGFIESLKPDAPGHALHPDLDVQPGDLIVDKVRYSAFLPISSTLDADLRDRGIETVIVTGTVTNACCESSARDAAMLGYKVFFISDATAALTDDDHNASLKTLGALFADVRTTEEMMALVAPARAAAAAE